MWFSLFISVIVVDDPASYANIKLVVLEEWRYAALQG